MITNPIITAYGGAGSVTGANFMFEVGDMKMLIDCGFQQGSHMADSWNWKPFSYDVKDIDILFVTHSHLDHIGRIPKLIHEGFRGQIISTPATKDLTVEMLKDSNHILSGSEIGKKYKLDKIYTEENLKKAMSLWKTVGYHDRTELGNNLAVELFDSGHVLGSCQFAFYYGGKTIVFTGDLGNSPSPLLRDTEIVHGADVLLMESVYGGRNHESREERRGMLKDIITENFNKKGVLMVPIFSLERSQEFLYEINELVEGGEVPEMPIFMDSPLAIRVTEIYKRHSKLFKEEVQKDMAGGDEIFKFPGLKETLKTNDSKAILHKKGPKIILAGSGMSSGGRIMHHEKAYLGDANNTLLLTGYQAPNTMGFKIQQGAKEVTINDQKIPIRAKVTGVYGYSGHKDSDNLLEFVGENKDSLQKVLIGMGEVSSASHLAQRITNEFEIPTKVLEEGERIELELFSKSN